MSRKRQRLSVGAPLGCRIVVLPVGIALASITAFMAWIAVDQTRRFLTGGDFGVGTVLIFVLLLAILVVVLYAVGLLTLTYLRLAEREPGSRAPFSSNDASCCANASISVPPESSCAPTPTG